MAIDLEKLSSKELQALIANAQSQMQAARVNLIHDIQKKIDSLLNISGLTLADVYPTRHSKGARKFAVAPKYRNPSNHAQTWAGRGKRPFWFVEALKRRGVTADSLLIVPASKTVAPGKTAAKKVTKKVSRKAVRKTAGKKIAKR